MPDPQEDTLSPLPGFKGLVGGLEIADFVEQTMTMTTSTYCTAESSRLVMMMHLWHSADEVFVRQTRIDHCNW